ncbi:MAG: hypothetical protein AT712_05225 [Caldivirga sp. CIS_19]|jgi:hypothetical protein|nr:MAG: hypothetical protein AT712_05225 [Caldivirga sp. CIS_19]
MVKPRPLGQGHLTMWVSCNGFINLCFTGVFNNPAIGGVTIKTPTVKPHTTRQEGGHSGFPRPVWLGSPGDGRGAATVRGQEDRQEAARWQNHDCREVVTVK